MMTAPAPPPSPPATTREAALALAWKTVEAMHPGTKLALRDETTGGGLHPPWVFVIAPLSTAPADQIPGLGPVLVEYGATTAEMLRSDPRGPKLAVQAWERAKYGSLQR
jgi:hypothetical protein